MCLEQPKVSRKIVNITPPPLVASIVQREREREREDGVVDGGIIWRKKDVTVERERERERKSEIDKRE